MQKRDVTTDQFRHNNPTQAQLYNLVSAVSVHITHRHEIKDTHFITTKWTRLIRAEKRLRWMYLWRSTEWVSQHENC